MHSVLRFFPNIMLKKGPIQLTFFVTARCNMECPFCFYRHEKRESGSGDSELSLEEIEKIASSLGPLLWLILGGGEPFLRQDLGEISRIFYRLNRPAILTYVTNGLMPGAIRRQMESILETVKESVVVVKLSLDGLGAGHDSLRAMPGSFERVIEAYYQLSELQVMHPNLELGFNTVFCQPNQYELPRIIDFVRGLGKDHHLKPHTHTVSMIRGNGLENKFRRIDLDQYLKVSEYLEGQQKSPNASTHGFRGARLKAAMDTLQHRLIHRTLSNGRRLIPCQAGRLSLVLSETGQVRPCETLETGFGNIRDHDCDFRKILRSGAARESLRSIWTGSCYCSHECNFLINILSTPALYPALAGQLLRLEKNRKN